MTAAAQMLASEPSRLGVESELRDLVRDLSFRRMRVQLASGAWSDHYFNLKPAMMDPRGAYLSALAFLDRAHAVGADYIGGLEMGAVPIIGAVAAIGEAEGRPIRTFFVRKKPKGHGTKELIEGPRLDESLEGKRVLVADDVATRGGSMMQAVDAVRAAGGIVDTALVLLDRQEGAEAFLQERGIRLMSVLQASSFL